MKSFKLLIFLFLLSCSSDDVPEVQNEEFKLYTGHYKVISFESDVAVDLNNDKVSSKELTTEINSFGLSDLDVRPMGNQGNDVKFLSFFLPRTDLVLPVGANFIDYGFATAYDFTDGAFKLKDTNYVEQAYVDDLEGKKTVSIESDLTVIDTTHLKISISKEFYDFNSNDWIRLNVDVTYERY